MCLLSSLFSSILSNYAVLPSIFILALSSKHSVISNHLVSDFWRNSFNSNGVLSEGSNAFVLSMSILFRREQIMEYNTKKFRLRASAYNIDASCTKLYFLSFIWIQKSLKSTSNFKELNFLSKILKFEEF